MMELKKIINLLRETEGYTSFNAEFANEIADALEKVENEKENLVHYNADLNNQLNKAESHIEKLEKQPEWISVEDKPFPRLKGGDDKCYLSPEALNSYIVYCCENNGIVSHWMRIEPPKPKEPTFKDVFFKKFPKAPIDDGGSPCCCIDDVFPCSNRPPCDSCAECWDRPYFEEEGEQE